MVYPKDEQVQKASNDIFSPKMDILAKKMRFFGQEFHFCHKKRFFDQKIDFSAKTFFIPHSQIVVNQFMSFLFSVRLSRIFEQQRFRWLGYSEIL
jgi:hypothetical protein